MRALTFPSASQARTLEFHSSLFEATSCCPTTVTDASLVVLGLRHTPPNPQPGWPLVCGPVFASLESMSCNIHEYVAKCDVCAREGQSFALYDFIKNRRFRQRETLPTSFAAIHTKTEKSPRKRSRGF